MSLGASQAGIDVRVAVDADRHAALTYSRNHHKVNLINKDIRSVTGSHMVPLLRSSDSRILFGGAPCQGFSYSNLRTRSKTNRNNWLFLDFLRIAKALEPEWMVFENVRGFENTAGGVFVEELAARIGDLGYAVVHGLLNAKDFGLPQDRARFFLVANRVGVAFTLPKRTHLTSPTVRDAIGDLPFLENGAAKSWMRYRTTAKSSYAKRLRGGRSRSPNHLVSKNAKFVLARYAHIPQGGNWENIPARLMKNYSDRFRCHTGIYYRLRYDTPSVVIGNYRKNMLIHPEQPRGLSVREAARIQSFPDHYEFCGSIGFQQQQVGDAVPPSLAKFVFDAILRS